MSGRTLLVAAFAAALFSSESFGAPRAQSAQECAVAADMALVAQSLADEAIRQPKALAIMTRIYGERGNALMKAIVNAAYARRSAFAEELLRTCLKSAGNMDSILGTSS